MTVETRIIALIDDIKHVEVTCPKIGCNGRLFIDLGRDVELEQQCPQCNKIWWSHSPAPDQKPNPVFAVLTALVSHQRRTRNPSPGPDVELIFPGPSEPARAPRPG